MSTTDQPNVSVHPVETMADPVQLDENSGSDLMVTVIRPRSGWIAVNWAELIQSHELFTTLILRDLKIRYKQTVLGVAWAVLQPLSQMLVFSFTFGVMMGVKSGAVPYPLFVFAGLVPWTFFSIGVNNAALSLLQYQNLLTKIYFPRLYIPAVAVGSALVDMAIGMTMFFFLLPYYHWMPGPGILALPLVILLAFTATLGLGLTLAAATVLYRDLRFVIPFAIQLGMFLSPVFLQINTEKVPRALQLVAALNPMFGVINGFRSSILGQPWDFLTLAISTVSAAGLLVFGIFFFRKTERLIADIV